MANVELFWGASFRDVCDHFRDHVYAAPPGNQESWQNPYLNDAQWEAIRFMKEKADRMNLGVKQLINTFAPGMEVIL